MLIEVRKAYFINKGAELMLQAIVDETKKRIPEAKLAIAPRSTDTYARRAELGLFQKVWMQKYHVQWGYLGSAIPKKLRQRYGLVLDSEINVVLDASGFSYSDQWGIGPSKELEKAIKKWKKQNTKVVLMPQAFGPFKHKKIKDAINVIVESADLVFARESISYEHIKDTVGECANVRLAPDFTNILTGVIPNWFQRTAESFCIIPNYRMIDKTIGDTGGVYISFLVNICKYLLKKRAKPFILIHGGPQDFWVAQQIKKELNDRIKIIWEDNPLIIKGIIGASDGVVSSRFHGLVNALSQGVPALATGWSHKYDMLLRDYCFDEGKLTVGSDIKEIQNKIDMITDKRTHNQIRNKITAASKIQKEATVRMWDQVMKVISSKLPVET